MGQKIYLAEEVSLCFFRLRFLLFIRKMFKRNKEKKKERNRKREEKLYQKHDKVSLIKLKFFFSI